MFGYILTNPDDLSENEKERYREAYCGLCHCLGQRHGQLSRLTLNFDLTFLVLMLSSLYEPEDEIHRKRCIIHPCKKHSYYINEYTEYAADMTIALSYFKCADDWKDEQKLSGKCGSSMLEKAYKKVKERRPVQCKVIEIELENIAQAEDAEYSPPDIASNAFGRLMAQVFAYKDDNWSKYLMSFGYGIGRYIYFADAAADYYEDKKTNSFNPLFQLNIMPEDMRPVLKTLLGEASEAFESLPLERDLKLLKNILYSGIWIKYNQAINKKEKKTNGSGPV